MKRERIWAGYSRAKGESRADCATTRADWQRPKPQAEEYFVACNPRGRIPEHFRTEGPS